MDDDDWNPDKELALELYDPETKFKLTHKDTRTIVTIIDDDKPGFLSFNEKKGSIKHIATEEECTVGVVRTNGSDGKITCRYRTV